MFENLDTDALQILYDSTLTDLLNKHAPRRRIQRRYQSMTPWFDTECSAARRKTRLFERRYRRHRTNADRLIWTTQVRAMHKLYTHKQNSYWTAQVKDSNGNPKKLWRTLSAVLCKDQSRNTCRNQNTLSADGFSKAFAAKVEKVRADTSTAPHPDFSSPCCYTTFNNFEPIDVNIARRLVTQAANKNCALDPAPAWIVKQFVEELSPFISCMINRSIRDGTFPSSQKCAIVTPILKKETLDPLEYDNYRPVSNLSFISKIFERAIYEQMEAYLTENNLLPEKQSSYCRNHSTETVVLDVLSDAYMQLRMPEK